MEELFSIHWKKVEKRFEEMGRTIREENRQLINTMTQEPRTLITQANSNGRGEGIGVQSDDDRRESVVNRREERMRRLKVPYFTGDNPNRWIYRAKRYFEINQIPDDEKVLTASICFEGKALNWFQWWEDEPYFMNDVETRASKSFSRCNFRESI